MQDQGTLWNETVDDSQTTEDDARRGGRKPAKLTAKMLHDIQVIVSRLVAKASQLIDNFTTNMAEMWMHMRCKFDGHKAFNRSQSGSWGHRCMGAGLRLNLGQAWGPQMWTEMTKSQNQTYQAVSEEIEKKATKDRKRKSTDLAKNSRRQSKYSKVDNTTEAHRAYSRHGKGCVPEDVTEDVPQEVLTHLMKGYYHTKVKVNVTEIEKVELATRAQSDSALWKEERYKHITASRVGEICKLQKKTKRSTKVESLFYSKFHGNKATQYGIDMEQSTRDHYVMYQRQNGHPSLEVQSTGLVISQDNPWIAASPDDRVQDPSSTSLSGLAEYKTPYSVRAMTILEACSQPKSQFCLEKYDSDGTVKCRLKKRHSYYFQVQCQMYCDNKPWCDFVVCTESDIHIERIDRDPQWWDEQLPKLKHFILTHFFLSSLVQGSTLVESVNLHSLMLQRSADSIRVAIMYSI